MPDSQPPSTGKASSTTASTPRISPEALDKCAQLIAVGEVEWPTDLSAEQQRELQALVRRFRRAKLVKFIASQIAADIAREREAERKRIDHDHDNLQS